MFKKKEPFMPHYHSITCTSALNQLTSPTVTASRWRKSWRSMGPL